MSGYRLLFLLAVSTTILCQYTYAGPVRSLALAAARAAKIPRSIRAPFRNTEMMTARGFGKRSQTSKFKDAGKMNSELCCMLWFLFQTNTKIETTNIKDFI